MQKKIGGSIKSLTKDESGRIRIKSPKNVFKQIAKRRRGRKRTAEYIPTDQSPLDQVLDEIDAASNKPAGKDIKLPLFEKFWHQTIEKEKTTT